MVQIKAINDLKRHTDPLRDELSLAMTRVVDSGWFVLGPEVSAFEQVFADYIGTDYCVSLANGTDALKMALVAVGVTQNSCVLTVANAGMYSTTAILSLNAQPVYVDVDGSSGQIDVTAARKIIASGAVDAVIVTHLYGIMADVEAVVDAARQHDVFVVEDCAQAHGVARNGRKAGSYGDVASFSFYPTKNLGALGDGGAVTTNHGELAGVVKSLRQYGWKAKYSAELKNGWNSRLDEIQAAILKVKLPKLDEWNARRRDIALCYGRGLSNKKVTCLRYPSDEQCVAHLYVIRVKDRASLAEHLRHCGVPFDIHYPIADYRQVVCADLFSGVSLLETDKMCNEVLTLPCFPEMTNEEVSFVIDSVNSWEV